MAVDDRYPVGLGGDDHSGILKTPFGPLAQDLTGLGLDLVFLARNEWDDIVQNGIGGDA